MKEQLQRILDSRLRQVVSEHNELESTCLKMETKKECHHKRSAEIVKAKAFGKIIRKHEINDNCTLTYQVHFQFLIRQKGHFYMEEDLEIRQADFYKGTLIKDEEVNLHEGTVFETSPTNHHVEEQNSRTSFKYNRLKAVQYAERWWNEFNPAYKKFENDCTNFISQCLHEAGAPMRGFNNRGRGWWMKGNNWSYSWTVAHSFRLYLANSKTGLKAKEVSKPEQLILGDVIFYDFEGDGRFNHVTIVTGKDYYGMPLVNAHTYNSRMRYWAYEDSTAYTPNIKYKFYTIIDD